MRRLVRQRPAEPRQTARRRVAGDAGIQYLHIVTAGRQRPLQLCCESVFRGQAITRRQAVAQQEQTFFGSIAQAGH